MSFKWSCSNCTYIHYAPAERCVMCQELRVTKKQMSDFIRGIPVPSDKPIPPAVTIQPSVSISAPTVTLTSGNSGSSLLSKPTSASSSATMGVHRTEGHLTPLSSTSSTIQDPAISQSVPAAPRTVTNPYMKKASQSKSQLHHNEPQRQSSDLISNAGSKHPGTVSANHNNGRNPSKGTLEGGNGNSRKPPSATMDPFKIAAQRVVARTVAPAEAVYCPGPVPLKEECADTWIYPSHDDFPTRKYQVEMTATALFHNSIVSLPTGLGKTLIGSVVMYNFHRWFPTGKIIFMAPTNPLVEQQVQACYHIMGIPEKDTALMTGKNAPSKRIHMWKDHSVFFCTPQTVQLDLESGICPANQVCCVVFDEAHRASGDHSYVKVVKYLEDAGAKFRVVGLTATAGANLKKIQEIIDVLRINKIDSRDESDPSVAPYTHDKEQEIVVVKQTSAASAIENSLNELIIPLLNELRSGGGLTRHGPNSSLTAYSLIMAKKDYETRNPQDKRLLGFFYAAVALVGIRDGLHKHGLGTTRSKLLNLRNNRQRGYLATVVKSDNFKVLCDEVEKALSNTEVGVDGRVASNPKLQKLTEILTEHFERAKLASKSSRAIVFSQFRDSVSEIVSILEPSGPLIRARHFIGQGKGGKKEGPNAKLKGMKQAEQHEVIRQFKTGSYNVLVCTSIGEEGLDIGEVDLIVNFDTLKNPIRMLQRVGRTGRKRDGRVVCLVSEGREERTLGASKQAIRTLVHALKSNKRFECHRTVPMLPSQPVRKDQKMVFLSQTFHMSQVGGLVKSNDTTNSLSYHSRGTNRWRLSAVANEARMAALGPCASFRLFDVDLCYTGLLRRLLSARSMRLEEGKPKKPSYGRTSQLLRTFESIHPPPKTGRPRLGRTDDKNMGLVFPLIRSTGLRGEHGDKVRIDRMTKAALESSAHDTTDFHVGEQEPSHHVTGNPIPSAAEPDYLSNVRVAEKPKEISVSSSLEEFGGLSSSYVGENKDKDRPFPQEPAVAEPVVAALPTFNDDFILPTQSDSSSSSEEDGDEDEGPTDQDPTWNGGEKKNDAAAGVPLGGFDDFVLPTQDSSSSESEDSGCCGEDLLSDNAGTCDKSFDLDSQRRSAKSTIPLFRLAESDDAEEISDGFPVPRRRTDRSKVRTLNDTPSSADVSSCVPSSERMDPRRWSGASGFSLRDTQDSHASGAKAHLPVPNLNADDIVCLVCSSGKDSESNPIILCDGPSDKEECHFAVHLSCYSLDRSLIHSDQDWRCDPCAHLYNGGTDPLICGVCERGGDVLRRFVESTTGWKHIGCDPTQAQRSTGRLRRLGDRPAKVANATKTQLSRSTARRRPFDEVSSNKPPGRETEGLTGKRRRQDRYRHRFVVDEAAIDSAEDSEGDEDELDLAAIEQEEALHDSFINDSSQLGYTQDDLDRIDPDSSVVLSASSTQGVNGNLHRALDMQWERSNQFATPAMSRRQWLRQRGIGRLPASNSQHGSSGDEHGTPASAPGSEKGLGRMHFIRSVLAHHERGGDADQIEQAYRELEEEPED